MTNTFFRTLATLPRKMKIFIMILADLILIPFALWSAIALRLGTVQVPMDNIWWIFILLPFLTLPLFLKLGLYRAVIRYFDEKILFTVVFGVTLSVLLMAAAVLMTQTAGIPRSSIIIYWVICITYITLSRYLARGLIRQFERKDRRRERVAIYGAGRAGLQTALSMFQSPEYQPVLFFDDNPELVGTSIAGIRVYKPEKAVELMAEYECYQLLLAIPSATHKQRKDIIRKFEHKGVQLKIIPGMNDIVEGQVKIENIREVGVEDLLGRDPVPPDEGMMSKIISGKNILVTGGGGSIGAELCRQLLLRNPQKLIIFEQNEFSLYRIDREILSSRSTNFPGKSNVEIISVLGDVLNTSALKELMKTYQIHSVYHAAAYKHVPLVEKNIVPAIENNVFGTLSVLKAIENTSVQNFILISSDKAVRPTNVMGATKRIAEMCVQMFAEKYIQSNPSTSLKASEKPMTFSMVRFGNVLGSSGSVVPLFKEQIKNGGPVTVTHPDITRYFMTIPEACELVIQAGAMAKGGDLFVLDMGEPVKIAEMAKNMILLSGFTLRDAENPEGDIAIEFVGLRPGEKLYEELLIGKNVSPTQHPRILRAQEAYLDQQDMNQYLQQLTVFCQNRKSEEALQIIKSMVKEFNHNQTFSGL